MSHISLSKENAQALYIASTEVTEHKIGGTTYIVSGKCKENGEELLDKIWRLIENDEE